jgi:hypothetical protein
MAWQPNFILEGRMTTRRVGRSGKRCIRELEYIVSFKTR